MFSSDIEFIVNLDLADSVDMILLANIIVIYA